jgi:uracil-DNA glycosylase
MSQLLFIGQAPPKVIKDVPFEGTHLYSWFERIDISKEKLVSMATFTALVSVFPGSSKHGHKTPTSAQITAERPRIYALIESTNPHIVIPVGTLAIREILGNETLGLTETIGNMYTTANYVVIPLPHPSGASPWIHLENNDRLLERALFQIQKILTSATALN